MNAEKATLPWNPYQSVFRVNLFEVLERHLDPDLTGYLPAAITLYYDPEVPREAIVSFIETATAKVSAEIRRWLSRGQVFVELDLLTAAEIEGFLTCGRVTQPWVLYYSRDGGLGVDLIDEADLPSGAFRIVTCANLANHGVAWRRLGNGNLESLLVTAPKPEESWDWESDIGHELAHAAFCQVPVFSTEIQEAASSHPLDRVDRVEQLESHHLARIAYHFSEIPVATLIEEVRPTETSLPVESSVELAALLRLADQLMPDAGFDRAILACQRAGGRIDTRSGTAAFEISAPIMRVFPRLSPLVQSTDPPRRSWYSSINDELRSVGTQNG